MCFVVAKIHTGQMSRGQHPMADILSQDEINALAEACRALGSCDEGSKTSIEKRIRLYDFSRPEKFSKDHLRTLNLIHTKYGTLFAVALAAMLRVDTQVNLLAIDQLTYREYCAAVPDGTLFAEVALEPFAPVAVFEYNPSLVSMLVDLRAGAATVSPSFKEITEIDKAIMRGIVDLSLKKYAEAWSATIEFNPRVTALTTESSTCQVLLPSEGVLVCSYEVSVAGNISMMSVCLPSAAVEAILPALALGKAINARNQKPGIVNEAVRKLFDEVDVECTAVLGRTSLTAEEIAALEVGDIIRLPIGTNEPAELLVENVPTFRGTLGKSGRNLALKITGFHHSHSTSKG